jgi:hypothetical protein
MSCTPQSRVHVSSAKHAVLVQHAALKASMREARLEK